MSIKNWPGGRISKTPPTPAGPYQDSAAPGVWTLDQVAFWQKQGLWPIVGNTNPDVFIENLFSTYLYTGNNSTQTITNGIDLSGKGGLVWIKGRSGATGHRLTDTARGATKSLESNSDLAQATESTGLTAFNGTGFTIGADGDYNTSSATYVSWAFRKQAKFFDVVTYTGNGTNLTVPHNLGSVPGCIIVKRTDAIGDWIVYHRGTDPSIPESFALRLNGTEGRFGSFNNPWGDTKPTATTFRVFNIAFPAEYSVNLSGATYVAYLFAHDAGGFGLTGTDNVISCGSYTGDGLDPGPSVNLGFEPQFLLVKNASAVREWFLMDTARRFTADGNDAVLLPNTSAAESAQTKIAVTSTGFRCRSASGDVNASGNIYIYIAIRRGPMKVPTSGTSVFSPNLATGSSSITTGFPVDMSIASGRTSSSGGTVGSRLIGSKKYLLTYNTETEATFGGNGFAFENNTGLNQQLFGGSTTSVFWNFRRAPGFFDVVAYTGTGVARTVPHNLAAVPEMMIVKSRSDISNWRVYHVGLGATRFITLDTDAVANTNSTLWNDTQPTNSVFTVGTTGSVNQNASTFIAYLFASATGVSKVGSYTGTGTTKQIDCGFTGGARFVLIKRTDSTGDWYVWDTARGIVAGNDPYLLLNSTAAEVTNTDYIDTYSAGFEISSTAPAAINANGGTFIFLAIA